jgi:hypothetical protein
MRTPFHRHTLTPSHFLPIIAYPLSRYVVPCSSLRAHPSSRFARVGLVHCRGSSRKLAPRAILAKERHGHLPLGPSAASWPAVPAEILILVSSTRAFVIVNPHHWYWHDQITCRPVAALGIGQSFVCRKACAQALHTCQSFHLIKPGAAGREGKLPR